MKRKYERLSLIYINDLNESFIIMSGETNYENSVSDPFDTWWHL